MVKHAHAGRTSLDSSAIADRLSITLSDNRIGLSADPPYSGLANLRHHAERRGGKLAVGRPGPPGTEVHWTIPLNP